MDVILMKIIEIYTILSSKLPKEKSVPFFFI